MRDDLSARRIATWLDLMRTTDKLLLAGLRRRIGPDGDLKAAYREWYAEQARDHDEAMLRIVHGLARLQQETSDAR
jgi:hypothetical protein